MIAHLTGRLIHKQPSQIVLDVGGVGYEVTIPLSTFYEVGEIGADVSINVHTHVREDAIQLFGFRTRSEKEVFLKLTGVSGVGPKLAISLLSGLPVTELVSAIKSNDLTRLTAIPGVGRKTAERLVVELRDKLAGVSMEAPSTSAASGKEERVDSALYDDTVAALVGLGYPKPVAERTVSMVMSEGGDLSIQSVLKRSLKRLSK